MTFQTKLTIAAVVAVVALTVIASILLRYEVQPGAANGTAYITDRWFGVTSFCAVGTNDNPRCFRLFPN